MGHYFPGSFPEKRPREKGIQGMRPGCFLPNEAVEQGNLLEKDFQTHSMVARNY